MLMDTLLSRQLMLKGIIAYEDWDYIKQRIFYSFLKDTYFSELKEMEIMRERFNFARDLGVQEFVGSYVSNMWIRQNILQQTEDVIENEDRQIAEEKAKGEGQPGMGMDDGMGGDGMDGGDADMTGGDEGGDLPPDEGEDVEPEEDDEEDTVEFTDKERAAITKAARQSGLNPKEVMGTFTDILSGDGDIGELSDEEKENIENAAKEAGVDVKTVMRTLNDLGGETDDEEDEEPTAESRMRFRTQLEKLWE
jgi:hypothetical protein